MIGTRIVGKGNRNEVEVTDGNALKVFIDEPPLAKEGTPNRKRFFKQVIENLAVDGSITPVKSSISAAADYDLFITRIIIIMSDGTQNASKYGALPALTNGLDLLVNENGIDTYFIEKAKTGGDLLVQSGMFGAFGSGSNVNVVQGWSSNDDALVATLDLSSIMGDGVRIGRGSTDSLTVVVNDDLTGLSDQFVEVLGYKLYE